MLETKFCESCSRKLEQGLFGMIGKEKIFEFKDGHYCEKCAKFKSDKSRRAN